MSEARVPSAKRARTDDASSPTTIIRSDIWHSDGSLILQAGKTQFRVHWSVLSSHSSVFKDMQINCQPGTPESLVEGCPVIELYDDPQSVKTILRVLYNPTSFLRRDARSKGSYKFAYVASLVRMGRKYDFGNLWDLALGVLEAEIPMTPAGYDDLRAASNKTTFIEDYPGVYLDILSLLREQNILSLLPSAYYLVVAKYTMQELLDGVARGDGTTAVLAAAELRQCILSRYKIRSIQFEPSYALSCFRESIPPAYYSDKCRNNDTRSKSCVAVRLQQISAHSTFPALFPPTSQLKGLCSICLEEASEVLEAGRQKGWEDLPSFFDLPPWSELKRDD
ncbi:BTB domain-containing protein [Mycena indigotica]|uniref:BTB domain-containing protein n=1 Tax=Mycena indigotica TaxID=2126181 RepID=A0A8H6WFV8_9AGAR|nr:BTB domain-containing protein [Mycena indigotica]KAF7315166.1 BTB domain-containing protein [Mycena indigotica]